MAPSLLKKKKKKSSKNIHAHPVCTDTPTSRNVSVHPVEENIKKNSSAHKSPEKKGGVVGG